MKILCVIDSLGSGGAQRQMVNLAIGFKERGHNVSFLVYHQENFFKETLEQNDIKVNEVLESNYLYRLWEMRRFIRGGNYDAVLSFLEAANFICELSGLPWRNWKLIVGERSANPKILKSFKLIIYRWFHLFADFVVANSHENIKIVRKINPLLPKSKCKVIYNMIDFNYWKSDDKYLFKTDEKFKLTIIASHQYLKNFNGLIEAINLLSEVEKKHIVISWYGNNINEPFIDNSFPEGVRKIKKYRLEKIFFFYPASQNITKIIQNSDAIGLFSIYEGLSNSICEAMACAKTVICSAISDNEIFINNRKLLCNPFDSKSIADSVKYLLQLSPEELLNIGSNNRIKARLYFEKEKIILDYLDKLKK